MTLASFPPQKFVHTLTADGREESKLSASVFSGVFYSCVFRFCYCRYCCCCCCCCCCCACSYFDVALNARFGWVVLLLCMLELSASDPLRNAPVTDPDTCWFNLSAPSLRPRKGRYSDSLWGGRSGDRIPLG